MISTTWADLRVASSGCPEHELLLAIVSHGLCVCSIHRTDAAQPQEEQKAEEEA